MCAGGGAWAGIGSGEPGWSLAGGGGAGWSPTSRAYPPPSFPGSGTQTLLERARAELGEAQAKLIEQESALKELSDRGESWTLPRPLIPHPGCHSTLDSHTNTYPEEGYRDPIL